MAASVVFLSVIPVNRGELGNVGHKVDEYVEIEDTRTPRRTRGRAEVNACESTVGKMMAAVHFTTMPREPNTAQKARRKPYSYNFCPCTKDIK